MKRLRLYVVIDVEDDALLEDLPASVAEVLDGTVGDPCFVGMSEGYAGEFAEHGADPTSWDPPPSSRHGGDCERNPCGLCRRRAELEGIFVSLPGEKFLCSSCLAVHDEIDVTSPNTEVWEVGGSGWLASIECMDCGEEIDVVLGDPDDDEAFAPERH